MADLIHVQSVAEPVFRTYVAPEYLDRFPGEYVPVADLEPEPEPEPTPEPDPAPQPEPAPQPAPAVVEPPAPPVDAESAAADSSGGRHAVDATSPAGTDQA